MNAMQEDIYAGKMADLRYRELSGPPLVDTKFRRDMVQVRRGRVLDALRISGAATLPFLHGMLALKRNIISNDLCALKKAGKVENFGRLWMPSIPFRTIRSKGAGQ